MVLMNSREANKCDKEPYEVAIKSFRVQLWRISKIFSYFVENSEISSQLFVILDLCKIFVPYWSVTCQRGSWDFVNCVYLTLMILWFFRVWIQFHLRLMSVDIWYLHIVLWRAMSRLVHEDVAFMVSCVMANRFINSNNQVKMYADLIMEGTVQTGAR